MQNHWPLLKDCPETLSPCTSSTLAGSCHPHLFHPVSRKSLSSGTDAARGCSPGPEGLKILRLGGSHTWKCRAETKQTHFTKCWAVAGSSRGPCSCLRSCSAARGHPSWLLALFATLISVSQAEGVLELHEKKRPVPSVAALVFPRLCPHLTAVPGHEWVPALRVCTQR